MSILDFLFEGTAPTPGTGSTTSLTQLPEWYTQYTKDMLGRAQGVANLPYAQYGGPRIAGFTPTEKTGFEMTKEAAGAQEPFLQGAQMALGAAGTTFPQMAQAYMNPYTENVVNRIADVGLRQLQEKFLPAVSETFIEAGQFGPGPGSSRMGEFGARALRDVQESVLGQQAEALQQGYGQAADIYGQDVSRLAELASRYGGLGETAQMLGLRGAQAVGGVGEAERAMQQANLRLAYEDFLRQQNYPAEQVKFLGEALSNIQIPKTEISQSVQMPALSGDPSAIEKAISGITGVGTLYDLYKKYFPSGGKSFSDQELSDLDSYFQKLLGG
jgi:hypothetical protein